MQDRPVKRDKILQWTLRLIAGFAVGVLLGFGLCGLDAKLYPGAEFGGSAIGGLGFVLILICALGLVLTVLVLLCHLLIRSLGLDRKT